MSVDSRQTRRILDDPMVIRAWAHPLRLKLHGLISREGPMTAAQAARQLGISQALASHHLRQLAKYGFVEQAEASDHRERPYRTTVTSWQVSLKDAEATAAADALEQLLAESAVANLLDWQHRRPAADSRWREHTGVAQSLVYLTADEMVEVRRAIDAVIRPLVERRRLGDPAARPEGVWPVDLTLICAPARPTASGG